MELEKIISVRAKKVAKSIRPYALWSSIFLGGLTGCGGGGGGGSDGNSNETPATQNSPIKKEVVVEVLNDRTMGELISDENGVLEFSDDTPQIRSLKKGDYIIGKPGPANLYGFLRRVENIQINTQQSVKANSFQTSQLNSPSKKVSTLAIAEPYAEVVINTVNGYLEKAVGEGVVKFNELREGFEREAQIRKPLYDKDGDLNTLEDQIFFEGKLSIKLSLDSEVEVINSQMTRLDFREDLQGILEAHVKSGSELKDIDESEIIYDKSLVTFVTSAGGVPIYGTVWLKVQGGIKGDFPEELSAGVSENLDASVGISYSSGKWDYSKECSNSLDFELDLNNANTLKNPPRGYISAKVDLMFYDAIGPYGELEGYAEVNLNTTKNPCLNFYGGLEGKLGVKMDILSFIVKEKEFAKIEIFRENLYSTNEFCNLPPTCTDRDEDGYSIEGGLCGLVDCDDNNFYVNPGAKEICDDGIDNNCVNGIDEGCSQDLPDLVVGDVRGTYTIIACPGNRTLLTLSGAYAKVSNMGDAVSPRPLLDFKVLFSDGSHRSYVEECQTIKCPDNIGVGEEIELTYFYNSQPDACIGTNPITPVRIESVMVDPNNSIPEIYEDNNEGRYDVPFVRE